MKDNITQGETCKPKIELFIGIRAKIYPRQLPIRATEFPLTDEGIRAARIAKSDLDAYFDQHQGERL